MGDDDQTVKGAGGRVRSRSERTRRERSSNWLPGSCVSGSATIVNVSGDLLDPCIRMATVRLPTRCFDRVYVICPVVCQTHTPARGFLRWKAIASGSPRSSECAPPFRDRSKLLCS